MITKKHVFILLTLAATYIAGAGGQIFFRIGSTSNSEVYYWLFFILGNLTCLVTTGMTMVLYKLIDNVNIAALIASAGAFICGQMAMWLCFRAELTLLQWLGICLIATGVFMSAAGKEEQQQ